MEDTLALAPIDADLRLNLADEARTNETASISNAILITPIEAVLARNPAADPRETGRIAASCWIMNGIPVRLTLLCIITLIMVSIALIVYTTCDRECCCKQKHSSDLSGIQAGGSIPKDQGSDAEKYLEELSQKILGIDRSSFQTNAAQIAASDWMAFFDFPRVHLKEKDRLIQRYALLVLYFAMGGHSSNALAWDENLGVHECDWERVICDERGMVSGLNLGYGVNLSGSIVQEIRLLSSLTRLDLSFNRIEGTILPDISALTNIAFLDLSYNELYGSIGTYMGSLSNLETLKLENNFLTGKLPASLKSLTKMTVFTASDNNLEGDIWHLISSWSMLNTLNVGTNFISGSISGEIGQLSHLKELDVSATEVYGSIPSEIGLLSSLRTLNAGVSKIKGSIPTELGNLNSSILELRLQGLQLERAEIPSELGRCTLLETLLLDTSELRGSLPSELGRLTLLKSFGISQNFLTGTIPIELGNMISLGQLNLRNIPMLEGSIPENLCSNYRDVSFTVTSRIKCNCCHQERKLSTEKVAFGSTNTNVSILKISRIPLQQ